MIDPLTDADYFAFPADPSTAPGGHMYVFEVPKTGATLPDPQLFLYDAAGEELMVNNQGMSDDGARIRWVAPVQGGTYYVAVRGYADSFTGAYTLRISNISGDIAAATPVSAGDTPGEITVRGEWKVYAFQSAAGATYTFECLLVTLNDCYMQLLTAAGEEIAFDDDGSVTTAGGSLITWTAPAAATYYIAVRGFDDFDTGTFTLSVR